MKVSIIGYGVVGGGLGKYLTEVRGVELSIFDPSKGYEDRSVLDNSDYVFICVPTPYVYGEGYSNDNIQDAMERMLTPTTVVIKSTVLPGVTNVIQQEYDGHKILFNPEFLREKTAYQDLIEPDLQLVGYTEQSEDAVEGLLSLLPPGKQTKIMKSSEAEMVKYVLNSFLATKLTFFNEIYDMCDKLGLNYTNIRDAVLADQRVHESHTDPFDGGYRGYSGKCLPKDTKSLIDFAKYFDTRLTVLETVNDVNDRYIR